MKDMFLRKVKNYLTYRMELLNQELQLCRERRELAKEVPDDSLAEVDVYHWHTGEGEENLGDYLAPVICDRLRARFDLPRMVKGGKQRRLLAVGSVLGFSCRNAVVWGSGVLSRYYLYGRRIQTAQLDVRCVRGPLTREYLLELGKSCPEVYGDPAILMPLIYTPKKPEARHRAALVRHFKEMPFAQLPRDVVDVNILTRDYEAFLDTIAACDRVISSSLHGIILAESYGIPAILLDRTGKMNLFKYRDYYFSTGRTQTVTARTVEEALELEPMPLPDLDALRQGLLDAFPKDLWEES